MNILMDLFIIIGPVAVVYCVYRAIRETRIRRIKSAPPWLITSIMNANGPDRRYNVR